MENISFSVFGEPMAKQRPRISSFKCFAKAYTPQDTINYENKVLSAYLERLKELNIKGSLLFDRESMVRVRIKAYFQLSRSDFGKKGLNKSGREKLDNIYCTKHKDADNIAKICLDALNGVCYVDDKQIVELNIVKLWTENTPRVEIELNKVIVEELIGA